MKRRTLKFSDKDKFIAKEMGLTNHEYRVFENIENKKPKPFPSPLVSERAFKKLVKMGYIEKRKL